MTQQLQTWNDIADHAVGALEEALLELEPARDWMDSSRSDGHGPLDHAKQDEAAQQINEARALIDQAKDALHASGVA